ncbi:MAG: 30S ribosomal protein S24e [Candidatus Woesearchaeota archaeon]|nr:30S ribosomal protein S24e [Candidatus Woesearchaeota archaeon]
MEVIITEKKENPLFSRTEINAEAAFTGVTPSRKELLSAIVSKSGSKPELVSIREIRQLFGGKKIQIKANIYKSEEQLKKIEPAYLSERNSGKKKKAEGEAKPK